MDLKSFLIWVSIAALGGILVLIIQSLNRSVVQNIILKVRKAGLILPEKWKTSFKEDEKEYTESITLKQRGHSISGDIVLRDSDEETIYKFVGTFKNLILSGTYISTDETDFEGGAILLRYTKKGKFIGQYSFFSKTSDKIVSSEYEWTAIS